MKNFKKTYKKYLIDNKFLFIENDYDSEIDSNYEKIIHSLQIYFFQNVIVKITLKDNPQNEGDNDNSNEEKDISNINNVKNKKINYNNKKNYKDKKK